jgi:hypothetical protein
MLRRGALLGDGSSRLAITGRGQAGPGGIGKTVLAAALTLDPAVRAAFPDGSFWLTVGQQPNPLAA